MLRAEGYSYKEICAETGWTYTKVNRCLAEGRRAFLERIARIESGAECERLAPHLSALADGEATADDLTALRPHLKGCLDCRARLREYRAAPSRVAALVAPAGVAAGGGDGGPLRGVIESVIGAVQERAAAIGERVHQATELAAGGKVAAVGSVRGRARGRRRRHRRASQRADRRHPTVRAGPSRQGRGRTTGARPRAAGVNSSRLVGRAAVTRAGRFQAGARAGSPAEPRERVRPRGRGCRHTRPEGARPGTGAGGRIRSGRRGRRGWRGVRSVGRTQPGAGPRARR